MDQIGEDLSLLFHRPCCQNQPGYPWTHLWTKTFLNDEDTSRTLSMLTVASVQSIFLIKMQNTSLTMSSSRSNSQTSSRSVSHTPAAAFQWGMLRMCLLVYLKIYSWFPAETKIFLTGFFGSFNSVYGFLNYKKKKLTWDPFLNQSHDSVGTIWGCQATARCTLQVFSSEQSET